MAGFNTHSFVYDSVPCDIYGLLIADLDGNGQKESDNFNSQIRTVIPPNSHESIFLGYESKEPLSFEITLISEKEVDAYTQGKIAKWLVGRNGFKKLQVVQPDLSSVIYYCIFTNLKTTYIAGYAHAFTLTGITNSPYQFEKNKVVTTTVVTSGSLTISNNSDIEDYIYPDVKITSTSGGDIEIINTSDADRSFKITGLSTGEVITISGKTQLLTSSTTLNRLGNFNKHWFRLRDGTNVLSIIGSATIEFTIPVIRQVGS